MKMKNKFNLRSIIVIIVLVIVVFMGGMYFGGRSTPAKEEITSTALTQKIRDINELAVSEYDYTKVGKFSNSLKFNGWTVPLTQKSFLITYEGKMKAGVDLSDVQVEKTDNKIVVKTSAVKILSNEIDENSIKVYDETKNVFNQISITDYKTFAKEQKKKVEKEAIKNQFLEKTETKVKKAIKDLIYMTVDQEQYEVEVEVSE